MLEMKVGQFPVETVLVEEKIDIAKRRVRGIANPEPAPGGTRMLLKTPNRASTSMTATTFPLSC
jgi:hypothetical protein